MAVPYERVIEIGIVEGVRKSGKQPEAPFHEGPTSEAIPTAIAHLKAHWEAIIESWKS